jgi:hypothetical protein
VARKMVLKTASFFVFAIFLLSFVSAVTVTDVTTTDITANAQNFASINARLTDLTNQIESQRIDDANFQKNAFLKSDVQGLYDNMVNIGKLSNQDMLVSNIVLFVVAGCLFFILVAKNMLPQHRKEDKLSTTKENLRLHKEIDGLTRQIEKLTVPKRGWFRKPAPVPTQPASKSNGVKAIADELNNPPTKKGLFKRNAPIQAPAPAPTPTPPTPNNPQNQHLNDLKKEFLNPNSKWREELIRAQERVKLLEELAQQGEN